MKTKITRTNKLIKKHLNERNTTISDVWECYAEMSEHAQMLDCELKVARDKIEHLQSLLDQPSGDCDCYGW